MCRSLSIVIPSHRRVDLLHDCLASLRTHAPIGTQIVVVDDGSRSACVSQTALQFPDLAIHTIRHAKPRGFCAAANAGIDAATGEIIELLNDDTVVTAGWAERALEAFDDPGVTAVAPLVLQWEPQRSRQGLPARIDSAGDKYDHRGFARKRGHGRHLGDPELAQSGPVWGVSATAGFYRRDVLRAVGCFPERFFAYFEDVDLSHRLRKAGRIVYVPESRVWHHVSSSFGKRPSRKMLEIQSRNEEWVYWRNVPDRWRRLPGHLTVLCGKACRRIQEGTLSPWLTGRIRSLIESA